VTPLFSSYAKALPTIPATLSSVSGRLKAVWLLAWAVLLTLGRRVFGRGRDGIRAFRANYDADHLPPVSAEERALFPAFSRCFGCGLCDQGEGERIAQSGGAYRGLMALVVAASRSMPDFRAAAYSFGFVPEDALRQKEHVCPAGVPFARLSRFVRDKADAVGGPLPLPPRIPSLPPRSVPPPDVR
jgi:hypothetical protein